MLLAPYLRFDAVRIMLDGYAETGSPIWSLSFKPLTVDTLSAVAGLRAGYDMPMSWGMLTATARFEYRSRIGGNYTQQLGYADLPGSNYTIAEQALARGEALIAAGLRAKTDQLGVDVEYQFRTTTSDIQSHTVRGSVRVGF